MTVNELMEKLDTKLTIRDHVEFFIEDAKVFFRNIPRKIKYFIQRRQSKFNLCGYSCWSMDCTIIDFLVEAIEKFINYRNHGVPNDYAEKYGDWETANKKFKEELTEMLEKFKKIQRDMHEDIDSYKEEDLRDAFDMLQQKFRNLWD